MAARNLGSIAANTRPSKWGDVLWKHLDQEVKTLGAESMRKYWTLADMRRLSM